MIEIWIWFLNLVLFMYFLMVDTNKRKCVIWQVDILTFSLALIKLLEKSFFGQKILGLAFLDDGRNHQLFCKRKILGVFKMICLMNAIILDLLKWNELECMLNSMDLIFFCLLKNWPLREVSSVKRLITVIRHHARWSFWNNFEYIEKPNLLNLNS